MASMLLSGANRTARIECVFHVGAQSRISSNDGELINLFVEHSFYPLPYTLLLTWADTQERKVRQPRARVSVDAAARRKPRLETSIRLKRT